MSGTADDAPQRQWRNGFCAVRRPGLIVVCDT